MNIFKTLKQNLIKDQNKLNFKTIPTSKVKTGEPFINLFPRNPSNLERIKSSMLQKNFDHKFPLVIWKERNILIDGHTRLEAARQLGLKKIPVIFESYKSTEEAKKAAEDLQLKRRNLKDQDIFQYVINNDTRSNYDKYQRQDKSCTLVQNKSQVREKLAKDLGVNSRKVQYCLSIKDRTDFKDELQMQILSGELTINEAYKVVMNLEKKQQRDKQEKEQKKEKEENCVEIIEEKDTLFLIIKGTKEKVRLLDFSGKLHYEQLLDKIASAFKENIKASAYEFLKDSKPAKIKKSKRKVV